MAARFIVHVYDKFKNNHAVAEGYGSPVTFKLTINDKTRHESLMNSANVANCVPNRFFTSIDFDLFNDGSHGSDKLNSRCQWLQVRARKCGRGSIKEPRPQKQRNRILILLDLLQSMSRESLREREVLAWSMYLDQHRSPSHADPREMRIVDEARFVAAKPLELFRGRHRE